VIRHDIATGNLVLGNMLFISLYLPPQWDLAPGVGRPEIIAGHERNHKKWVASGRAWYVIFDGERRWAMELDLRARFLPKKHGRTEKLPGGEVIVHEHPATVRWRARQSGFFHRHTTTILRVEFDCPASDRHLTVELSGRCPQEGFEEMLAAMSHWRCH
jgi:hypothetical protein